MAKALIWADVKARLTASPIMLNGAALPVAFPNEDFQRPEPPAPWLLVEVAAGLNKPVELGGGFWQTDGQVFVHVLVVTGTGTDDATTIEDQVLALFRRPAPVPSFVLWDSVDGDPGGPGTEDGAYWRTSIIANCRVDSTIQGA
jgi:hypothetical protein